MAVMKTLAIAMEDGALLDNEEREEARRQAWHDGIAGNYNPDQFDSVEQRRAYRLGRDDFEETCTNEGINL